jgi:hypothetical protein
MCQPCRNNAERTVNTHGACDACSCTRVHRVATVPAPPAMDTMAHLVRSCGPAALHLLLQRRRHSVPDIDEAKEFGCNLFPRDRWQAFALPEITSFFLAVFLAVHAGPPRLSKLPQACHRSLPIACSSSRLSNALREPVMPGSISHNCMCIRAAVQSHRSRDGAGPSATRIHCSRGRSD